MRCVECGNPIKRSLLKAGANDLTCSPLCSSLRRKALRRELNPTTALPSATTGAISELRVGVDLLMRGFEVFRALSPSCSCDLAILREGKLLRVEVRTGTVYRKANGDLTYNQQKLQVRADILAAVYPDRIIYKPELLTPVQAEKATEGKLDMDSVVAQVEGMLGKNPQSLFDAISGRTHQQVESWQDVWQRARLSPAEVLDAARLIKEQRP